MIFNRCFLAPRYADLVPVSFLYILRDNLNKIIDEGLPNVIERHYVSSRRLQTALVKVIGLELFVDVEEHRLPTVITVKMPVGINDKSFTKYLSDRWVSTRYTLKRGLLMIFPPWLGIWLKSRRAWAARRDKLSALALLVATQIERQSTAYSKRSTMLWKWWFQTISIKAAVRLSIIEIVITCNEINIFHF